MSGVIITTSSLCPASFTHWFAAGGEGPLRKEAGCAEGQALGLGLGLRGRPGLSFLRTGLLRLPTGSSLMPYLSVPPSSTPATPASSYSLDGTTHSHLGAFPSTVPSPQCLLSGFWQGWLCHSGPSLNVIASGMSSWPPPLLAHRCAIHHSAPQPRPVLRQPESQKSWPGQQHPRSWGPRGLGGRSSGASRGGSPTRGSGWQAGGRRCPLCPALTLDCRTQGSGLGLRPLPHHCVPSEPG